jgi:hypothetical protein
MPPPPTRPRIPFRWAGEAAATQGARTGRSAPRGVGLLPVAGPGAEVAEVGGVGEAAGPRADTLLELPPEWWPGRAGGPHLGRGQAGAGEVAVDDPGTSGVAEEVAREEAGALEISTEIVPELRLRRPGQIRRVILVALVLVLAAGLVGAGVLIGRGLGPGPGGASKGSPSRPPARQLPAAVATFASLLSSSARAGRWTSGAVAGACQLRAPGTKDRQALVVQVGGAIRLYQSVLARARANSAASSLPGGQALGALLVMADTRALSASQDFQAWLVDLQATGCYGGPTNDLHYQQAVAASRLAREASQRLASAWAPVAGRYGLPSWDPSQIR